MHGQSPYTSIGAYVFLNCSCIEEIYIPASVTSIGEQAFYNCFDVSYIYFDGKMKQWDAIEKGTLWNGNLGWNDYNVFDLGVFLICQDQGAEIWGDMQDDIFS